MQAPNSPTAQRSCLKYSDHVTLRCVFSVVSQAMSLCKGVLLIVISFSKISFPAKYLSVAFTGKTQRAMRAGEVGEQAWFVLEEAFLWGREAKMCHTASHPTCSRFLSFSVFLLEPKLMPEPEAPSTACDVQPQATCLLLEQRSRAQHQRHVLRNRLSSQSGGRRRCDAVLSAAIPGRRAALPRGCVPHCHLVTGPESRERAARGQ